MKSIGRAEVDAGAISYRMHRNFGICNKYIYKRDHHVVAQKNAARPERSQLSELDDDSIAQLTAADTVFLASYHEVNGADSTHRGGPAGFVSVIDKTTISIPDYMGNGMFNTLGNLRIDDRIGFLAVDFATGRSVHLAGRGLVRPSPEDDAMSERTLVIEIDEVRVTHQRHGQWVDVEEFPHRPGLINPATPYLSK